MFDKLKKFVRHLMDLICVILLVLALVIMVNVIFTSKNSVPSVGGYSILRVLTGSMEPTIKTDSLIVIKKVDGDEIKVGDIVSYYSKDPTLHGMVNTHRITKIDRQQESCTVYTKGDANTIEDKYTTSPEHIIGKVVWNNYGLGVLLRLISNPLIFVPIIVAPLIFIIIYYAVSVFKTAKEISRQQEEAYNEALNKILENKKNKE